MPRHRALLAALLGLSAPAFAQPTDAAARYQACLGQARTEPGLAEASARAWGAEGGGLPARHCRAVALLELGRAAEAADELTTAAKLAAAEGRPTAPALWGQAGNAELLAGRAPPARAAFSAALAAAGPNAPLDQRAGWLIDRARAAVAASDPVAARADLDSAMALAPQDPQALMFSAALAWRMKDGPRARREIALARRLDPADPTIAAEAQRIGRGAMDTPAGRASEQIVPALNPLF